MVPGPEECHDKVKTTITERKVCQMVPGREECHDKVKIMIAER
jgi:hypothetical protein